MKTLDRRNSSIKLLIEVAAVAQRGVAVVAPRGVAEAVQHGAAEAVQCEPVEAAQYEAAQYEAAAAEAAAAEAAAAEGRVGYGRLWAGSPSVSTTTYNALGKSGKPRSINYRRLAINNFPQSCPKSTRRH